MFRSFCGGVGDHEFLRNSILLFVRFYVYLGGFFPDFGRVVVRVFASVVDVRVRIVNARRLSLVGSGHVSIVVSFSVTFTVCFTGLYVIGAGRRAHPGGADGDSGAGFPHFFRGGCLLSGVDLPRGKTYCFHTFSLGFANFAMPSHTRSIERSLRNSSISDALGFARFKR